MVTQPPLWQPVPMLDHSFSKEIFPNVLSKPLLMQREAVSSHPIASYLGEETNTCLTTSSFQVVVESNKVPLRVLQTKQLQFRQSLLVRLVLQTPHQPRCPSLDKVQHLSVLLVVRGQKLNTVFEVQPHQCWVQGHDHCPTPDIGQKGLGHSDVGQKCSGGIDSV